MTLKSFLAIFCFSLATAAIADKPLADREITNSYQSGDQQVQLLELYTSEGCSSCPSADRWLSQQQKSSKLWKEFVPISFHVSYWDWIGWQDKYANKLFNERQRKYAENGALPNVYTPGFLLNGKEWRGFFQHHKALPKPQPTAAGNLQLTQQGQQFSANFTGNGGEQLHIAILAMDVTSKITRGENSNKRLTHDFVVVGYQHYMANTTVADGQHWRGKLPTIEHHAKQYAIAVWVSGRKSQQPLQALGGEFKPQSN